MSQSDILSVFQWWFVLFSLSITFLPLTISLFPSFFDKGYSFSKIMSSIVVAYSIFVLSVFHLVPFTRSLSISITLCLSAIALFIAYNRNEKKLSLKKRSVRLLKEKWAIFLFEELLFIIALLYWAFIRSHQPDINGLEKYMDFGFVNSILRSAYFPPRDMWFTPFPINYYYFGHLLTAVITKLSGIQPAITFNLMLATLFAYACSFSFSLGANTIFLLEKERFQQKTQPNAQKKSLQGTQLLSIPSYQMPWVYIAGLLACFLLALAGNLHTMYTLFLSYPNDHPVPPWQLTFSPTTFSNQYWYPNATRFIYNTIHEFPIYSFVVSDLHGHVLDIPIVLLLIALLLQLYAKRLSFTPLSTIPIGFFIGVSYMTNAWDGFIYILLSLLVILLIIGKPVVDHQRFRLQSFLNETVLVPFLSSSLFLFLTFILVSLPFSYFFNPSGLVHGIGVVCAPQFLVQRGHLGPFLFEADHCQRSPLWQLIILYGFFYFWVISLLVFLRKRKIYSSDWFITTLILLSTILIIIPEFFYAKDIYPAHYRANTMFKLVYQAFMMLSLVSAYTITRLLISIAPRPLNILKFPKSIYTFLGLSVLALVAIYPYFAVNSYYGNLQAGHGLYGLRYLKELSSSDYNAILWLNDHITGQPVILEAQGDSYTNFARVSSNTGLPTVLGWTVHEWLWRGSYDIPAPRITDVATLYQSTDIQTTKTLIKKYNISLVFIGSLERQKYTPLQEEKWQQLGKPIFHQAETTIYQLTSS